MNWFRKKRTEEENGLSIGLALGGGGVRGLAHAGVLSVFDREGIPIKAIAGTSMGAIVAAAYSLNPEFDKKDLINLVANLGINVPTGLNEDKRDKDSFLKRIRQFIDAERMIVDAALGWGILPQEKVVEFLRLLTLGKELEDGRTRLAIVTTDLLSGDKIVFKDGPAVLAVQASSAIPGFLPPVHHQGRLLADGAFVDLVPCAVVREFGVDIVLAVDVDQEGVQVEVRNGIEAFMRAVELCARHHKNHHLKLADMVIRPDFGTPVNPLDVSKTELCIEAGVQAAEQMLPELRELLSGRHSVNKSSELIQ